MQKIYIQIKYKHIFILKIFMLMYVISLFLFLFYPKIKIFFGAMSEWLMWGTVNIFFRGSIPLGAF